MTIDFAAPSALIQRDRYGRPLVTPPGGGKPIPYTRCTTYIDVLDDKTNLSRWQRRQVLRGLIARPDLATLAHAKQNDDRALDRIADDAIQAAASDAKANMGTALHAMTEQVDDGAPLDKFPPDNQPDLAAYQQATAPFTVISKETFVVNDDHKVGGTFDRIVELDGERYIADIKTGRVDYSAGKIAMQLAMYAHSHLYDPATGSRAPHGANLERGIVIHLPAGEGKATLYWADLTDAWDAMNLAREVRAWRAKRTGWLTEMTTAALGTLTAAGMLPPDPIRDAIQQATTAEQLGAVWLANYQAGWTDAHTELAANRKNELAALAEA